MKELEQHSYDID